MRTHPVCLVQVKCLDAYLSSVIMKRNVVFVGRNMIYTQPRALEGSSKTAKALHYVSGTCVMNDKQMRHLEGVRQT